MPGTGSLAGKRAVVTGAAAGIGRATGLALARQGVRIEAVDRVPDGLASLAAEAGQDQVGEWVVDLSRPEEVEELVERVEEEAGPIDLLINVAGIGLQASVLDTSPEDLRRLFEVDFFAAVTLSREALRVMAPRRRGHIINVTSASARRGLPGMSAYAAAKAALHGFTQSLRLEAFRHGVDVSEVLPISVRTGFFAAATNRSTREYAASGWMQTPEYVADLIVACACRPVAERITTRLLHPVFALDGLCPNLVEWVAEWYYRRQQPV